MTMPPAMLGGQLGALLEARCETVASLAGELSLRTADQGVRFELLDGSGSMKGYATGLPEGDAAAAIAWRVGIDIAACAHAGAAIGAIAYAATRTRVALDWGRTPRSPGGAPLVAALRPTPPDRDSPENLAAKLRVARAGGVDRVDFYHYGMAPLSALDRIREALALAGYLHHRVSPRPCRCRHAALRRSGDPGGAGVRRRRRRRARRSRPRTRSPRREDRGSS